MKATQGASNRVNGTNNKSDDMIYDESEARKC